MFRRCYAAIPLAIPRKTSKNQFGYAYDPAGNLNYRTNNALVQTFAANNLNELSTVTRSGTLTVAGTTTSTATNVTVNGSAASRYADSTFALGGFTVANGKNTFTAIAQDSYSRKDTNSANCRERRHFSFCSTDSVGVTFSVTFSATTSFRSRPSYASPSSITAAKRNPRVLTRKSGKSKRSISAS